MQTTTDKIVLAVSPAPGRMPLTVAVKLDGDDAHADLRMQPTEFGRWWKRVLAAQPGQPPPGALPFTGNAEVQHLDLGWLKAKGLTIDAGPDLAPAPSSTAAPPSASSVH